MFMLPGKVPPELLRKLLDLLPDGERVLIGPGEGIDATAIDFGGEILVASTDPITGASRRIGFYAVHVNANDVATFGAEPKWFLTTVLLPESADEGLAAEVVRELSENARKLGVAIVGGHTEVTPGLDRPIVVGTMLGTVKREKLVLPGNIEPGDRIVLTKWAGLEGTAIIAEERAGELAKILTPTELERARNLIEMISVVPEAMIARDFASGMHDPTEGGIANGLHEMANASGLGFRVFAERIPVLPETRKICEFYGLNPLALIGSGSLLVAVPGEREEELLRVLREAGIPASPIGEFTEKPAERVIVENGSARPLERPETDELWKVV